MTVSTQSPIDPKRLDRARAISESGDITSMDAVTWHVKSQSGSGYHLVKQSGPGGLEGLECTCADYMKRNYPEVGLQAPCKHSIAVGLEQGFIHSPLPSAIPPVVDLDAYEDVDDFPTEFQEVSDRLQADGILWQLSRIEEEVREIEVLAAREIEQIQNWKEREAGRLQDRIRLFSSSLEAYLKKEQRKSMRLPHGEIKLRKTPDKLLIDDEVFDLSRDEFVRLVPEQRKADIAKLKKHLKATGELLPGVDLELGEVRFSATCKTSNKEE